MSARPWRPIAKNDADNADPGQIYWPNEWSSFCWFRWLPAGRSTDPIPFLSVRFRLCLCEFLALIGKIKQSIHRQLFGPFLCMRLNPEELVESQSEKNYAKIG